MNSQGRKKGGVGDCVEEHWLCPRNMIEAGFWGEREGRTWESPGSEGGADVGVFAGYSLEILFVNIIFSSFALCGGDGIS